MSQRLPIVLAQVKTGYTSDFLCRVKKINKKVYNNIMNSINL